MKEMLIKTASRTLRDTHKDVWRMAHAPQDRGENNRSFQFRRLDDEGHILVRGPHLPDVHSTVLAMPEDGTDYLFSLLVRAVKQSDQGERQVPESQLQEWLQDRLPGAALVGEIDYESETFPMNLKGCVLRAYHVNGKMRVNDALQFIPVMERGVGRSKAFGFGMMILESAALSLAA